MPHPAKPPAKYLRALVALAHEVRPRVPVGLGPAGIDDSADAVAQAVACAVPILQSARVEFDRASNWLNVQLAEWERFALDEAHSVLGTQYSVLSTQYQATTARNSSPPLHHSTTPLLPFLPSPSHLYDHFLHHFSHDHRKRRGVFFTPQPVARYIVAEIDRSLRHDFGFIDGIASHFAIRNPHSALHFIDPALGTGIFLLELLDQIHRQLTEQRKDWNDFVPNLLPRLSGIEILPAPCFLAKLNLAIQLAQTGYDFHDPTPLNIHCGDALDPNLQFAICNLKSEIPILLGNPPFSSLSPHTNPWIARLVRGGDEVRGYIQAGDQRLGERKTWLHDDYVKFLRLAQWHIEQAGCGIVGFVTNHGYLDNATFRLMRSELLRVFPRIRLVDLHGSRKKGETSPDGRRDENIFGLDQGVAIALLARSASEGKPPSIVEYAELWGTCDEKLATLKRSVSEGLDGKENSPSLALRACVLTPSAPHFRFVPSDAIAHAEYDCAWSLADVMPVNTSAPVTARDHFVVAFTREQLIQRIEQFRDLSISDEEIRRCCFQRTRSSRYPLGDSRGWKLAAARRIVAADADWQDKIICCLYRPFDWRYVFWHPAMIDWPRNEVTRHLIGSRESGVGDRGSEVGGQRSESCSPIRNPKSEIRNLCLLSRRQQLPTQPCSFFWIADGLALDGVIRSDNRGSESLFPLFLLDDQASETPGWKANFAAAFIAELTGRVQHAPEPIEILGYIYALFHSPAYRERYAPQLRSDFPRVLLPGCSQLFFEMSRLGRELIDLHCLQSSSVPPAASLPPAKAKEIQAFRVGGYVALRKWLQPPHRLPADSQYQQITAAIARTIDLMAQIDQVIHRHGGFPAAFVFTSP